MSHRGWFPLLPLLFRVSRLLPVIVISLGCVLNITAVWAVGREFIYIVGDPWGTLGDPWSPIGRQARSGDLVNADVCIFTARSAVLEHAKGLTGLTGVTEMVSRTLLGAHLLRTPGARMTVVAQTP